MILASDVLLSRLYERLIELGFDPEESARVIEERRVAKIDAGKHLLACPIHGPVLKSCSICENRMGRQTQSGMNDGWFRVGNPGGPGRPKRTT